MKITADEIAEIVVELRKFRSDKIEAYEPYRLLDILVFLKKYHNQNPILNHFDLINVDHKIKILRRKIERELKTGASRITPDDFMNQFN